MKQPVYFQCSVSDLSTAAIGTQLQSLGWVAAAPRATELLRYSAPSMIVTVQPSVSGGNQFLVVTNVPN
jgi:hypothetical protein